MGLYDIPAEIEYILNATGREKLIYIGHSMGNHSSNLNEFKWNNIDFIRFLGTTMFWVAMETHPELNEKIELMV